MEEKAPETAFPRFGEVLKTLRATLQPQISTEKTLLPARPAASEGEKMDPDERELAEVCRQQGLRLMVALDPRRQDKATARRRQAVLRELLRRGWSDARLTRFFAVDARTLRRRRAEGKSADVRNPPAKTKARPGRNQGGPLSIEAPAAL